MHLFSSWFNRGFLVLRRIDWSTPAIVLEKIIRYEAVHQIRDWDDLRRRIDPPDRRCYAFFHPALNDEPLIFVEVAFTDGIPDAIGPILGKDGEHARARARQHGGVLFDLELPARACRRQLRQLPDQAGGGGGLARVLAALDLRDAVAGAGLRQLARARAQERESDPARRTIWQRLPRSTSRTGGRTAPPSGWKSRCCARPRPTFSARKGRSGLPLDPVARFHLGNGARLEQLDFLGDLSEKGLAQSHGLMVNYQYDLDDIEKNHEAFAENRTVVAASGIRKLARVPRELVKV